MDKDTNKIEISFPIKVHISNEARKLISNAIDIICKDNCPEGHVMWCVGHGCKPTYIPLTQYEEQFRGAEFDRNIEHFEIICREKHKGE